jgi:hypothetical protein
MHAYTRRHCDVLHGRVTLPQGHFYGHEVLGPDVVAHAERDGLAHSHVFEGDPLIWTDAELVLLGTF